MPDADSDPPDSNGPEPAWSDLVCARVLHDLVGPVGAINNGLELLEDMGPSADALGLIGNSARQTADRLKLFRLAYGAGGYASAATLPTVWAMLAPVLAGKRVTLDPLPSTAGDAAPGALGRAGVAKTLALAAIALGDTALRGGRLTLDPAPPDALCALTLTAERIAGEALAGLAADVGRPTNERAVPARLAQEVAAGLGMTWVAGDRSDPVTLRLRQDFTIAAKFIRSI
jgi:histidine phosphotransferase ChpT